MLSLIEPAVIIGDIHGQFYDLIKIFDLCGDMDSNK